MSLGPAPAVLRCRFRLNQSSAVGPKAVRYHRMHCLMSVGTTASAACACTVIVCWSPGLEGTCVSWYFARWTRSRYVTTSFLVSPQSKRPCPMRHSRCLRQKMSTNTTHVRCLHRKAGALHSVLAAPSLG